MNPRIKNIWIEALRSGRYPQGKRYLRSTEGYCCLGVLADCYLIHNNLEWKRYPPSENDMQWFAFSIPGVAREEITFLPGCDEHFKKWFGGVFLIATQSQLAHLNDLEELDFTQIADWIEQNL